MYKIRAFGRWLRDDDSGQFVLAFLLGFSTAAAGYIYGYRAGRRDA